jgi:glycerophosphoryl diester phosphodiesterase
MTRDQYLVLISWWEALLLSVALGMCCLCTVSAWAESRCLPSAHRGDHATASENSIEAIRAAGDLPFVEIDIRVTADNELVLFHDRRVSTTNVRGGEHLAGRPISSLSREELSDIRFPDGSRIPKLRAALREVQGRAVLFMLDIKSTSSRDFKRVMDEVHETGGETRIVVQCQTKSILDYMRTEYPKVAVLARAHAPLEVETLLQYSPEFVQIDHDWDVEDLGRLIHKKGARVVVKTLAPSTDQPATWRKVCAAGADVVLTDRPRDLFFEGVP